MIRGLITVKINPFYTRNITLYFAIDSEKIEVQLYIFYVENPDFFIYKLTLQCFKNPRDTTTVQKKFTQSELFSIVYAAKFLPTFFYAMKCAAVLTCSIY